MRWKYPDPTNLAEEGQRKETLQKIDAWWKVFESKTADINALFKRQQKWDLAGWMHQHLQAIDSQLMWEFGPGLMGGHRLVITPESSRQLRPLVDILLEKAPHIPCWEFYAYRVPENLEQTKQTVAGRTKGDITRTKFKAESGQFNRIDLTFSSRDYTDANRRQAFNDCFVACETLLGEEVLDKWVGCIDVVNDASSGDGFLPVEELLPTVKTLIVQIVNSLSAHPCFETSNTATWTMYNLKTEEAADYPDQSDMYVGKTMLPEMWTCAHSGQTFDSERFSKHNEVFAYLKLDGSEGLDEEKFADKAEIEDALDAILIGDGLGSVIGGGTGSKYSYIDFALTDAPKGIDAIRSRMRDGNVPKRSWILFFDSNLQDEWIGIWDETPPPPR